ncbi:MAG TPA: HAMP domain-containing sensor histidine kinase, partial [Albitalea sp.]|nr:HAMP domain-containing sensor histidine kinase [Albitalea sp.]
LNAVVASARVLAISPTLSDGERAVVERIERASQRLSGMLADLRDFTRARLGGLLIVRRARCDVGALVRQVVGELQSVHPNRHITVECQGNLMLDADGQRVAQLLSNLIANAFQHSADDSDVQVRATREADAVTIEVHNTGPAIPPALMKRVFAPLSREEGSDSTHLGLGLYIAHQIARAHGGDIAVQSSAGAGTRFTARLPSEG